MPEGANVVYAPLALTCERQQRGYEARAVRLLGEIALHRDRPEAEKAAQHYRTALTVASQLGMRPLIAHCHFGLGKLARSLGERSEPQDHLATAAAMYREMDMPLWLSDVESRARDRE